MVSGQAKSLAEIEAEMKGVSVSTPPPIEVMRVPQNIPQQKPQQRPQEDQRGQDALQHMMQQTLQKQQNQEAFNMFVAQMRANGNLPDKPKVAVSFVAY